MVMAKAVAGIALLLLAHSQVLFAGEIERTKIPCLDNSWLEAEVARPKGLKTDAVRRVVVLLHGSGPQNMDLDLTAVTKDRQKNLVFVDVRDALLKRSFAVVRYDKRSYRWKKALSKDPSLATSEQFLKFQKNALRLFVDDARAGARFARKRFPRAHVYYFGVSQGTWVGLQAAHLERWVQGVALVGFYTGTLDTILFEQLVYRPLRTFRVLDIDGNERLTKEELGGKGHDLFRMSLLRQFAFLDQN